MARVMFGFLLVFFFAIRLLAAGHIAAEEGWQTYIDNTYKVTLRFPSEWKKDPLYFDRPYFGTERRPHSVVHSFQLLAMGDEDTSPEQACKGEAGHVLKPFGENPTIRPTKVDEQSACLIWPSTDQGTHSDAAVFVRYPEPVKISGDRYSILEVYGDKDYILEITGSVRFISSTHPNPPFLLNIAAARNGKSGATWKADAPFPLLLRMKNSSEKVLHVELAGPASSYRVMAIYKDEPVRVTENLPEVKEELKDASPPTRSILKTLKPSETCQDAIEIRFFAERERPGEYSLQVEQDLPAEVGKGFVESNTLTVTVIN